MSLPHSHHQHQPHRRPADSTTQQQITTTQKQQQQPAAQPQPNISSRRSLQRPRARQFPSGIATAPREAAGLGSDSVGFHTPWELAGLRRDAARFWRQKARRARPATGPRLRGRIGVPTRAGLAHSAAQLALVPVLISSSRRSRFTPYSLTAVLSNVSSFPLVVGAPDLLAIAAPAAAAALA